MSKAWYKLTLVLYNTMVAIVYYGILYKLLGSLRVMGVQSAIAIPDNTNSMQKTVYLASSYNLTKISLVGFKLQHLQNNFIALTIIPVGTVLPNEAYHNFLLLGTHAFIISTGRKWVPKLETALNNR